MSHVLLEWKDIDTGETLFLGKIAHWDGPHIPGEPSELAESWYSLVSTQDYTAANFPLVEDRLITANNIADRARDLFGYDVQIRLSSNFAEWSAYLETVGISPEVTNSQHRAMRAFGSLTQGGTPQAAREILGAFLDLLVQNSDIELLDEYIGELAEAQLVPVNAREHPSGSTANGTSITLLTDLAESFFGDLKRLEQFSAFPLASNSSGKVKFLQISFDEPDSEILYATFEDHLQESLCNPEKLQENGLGRYLLKVGAWDSIGGIINFEVLDITSPSAQQISLCRAGAIPSGRQQYWVALVFSIILARWEQGRTGFPRKDRLVIIDDDDHITAPGHFPEEALQVLRACDVQYICTTSRADSDTLSRFASVVAMYQDHNDGLHRTRINCLPSSRGQVQKTLKPFLDTPPIEVDHTPLSDIFHVLCTPQYVLDNSRSTTPEETVSGVLLTAAGIAYIDLEERMEDPHAFVRHDGLLRAGDIVLPKIFEWPNWRGEVDVRTVPEGHAPLVPSDAVVVLRPRLSLREEELTFYLLYFRSEEFLAHYANPAGIVYVDRQELPEMPIPRPDRATLSAIAELVATRDVFEQWSNEASEVVQGFFKWREQTVARSHVIHSGRLIRQRREAANIVNSIGPRVRATFPYPLAKLWRTVQAAQANESGYGLALKCAEATVTYCAALGVAFATGEGIALGRLRSISGRIDRGVTLGDWLAVLRELCRIETENPLPADSPLAQYAQFASTETDALLDNIARRRNAYAHRRGPEAHEIENEFEKARAEVESLLKSAEWLVDYPIRHIDVCQWDSFEQASQISYRELMGDHNIVPSIEDSLGGVIESGSLYAVDRYARYQLLRPFFLSQPCVDCGQMSIFIIDRYDSAGDTAEYLALDHSHSVVVRNARRGLESVGLLRRSS